MPIKLEQLEDVLRQDIARRNVVRLEKITSSGSAVASGENYTSFINRVQLDGVLGSGKKINMSLIVKELPTQGKTMDFFVSESFYETEVKIYQKILPKIEDVLNEQGVPPLWPTFLGKEENYLIFSDLKRKNYQVNCRKSRLDLDHGLLTVRTLALFHSASIVLKERGQLDTTGYLPPFVVRYSTGIRRFRSGATQALARNIIETWGPEWTKIGERLDALSNRPEEVERLGIVDEKRLNVLCHGDPWVTNMMFKYSKGIHLPIGVRFLDFQVATYNSYAFDLLYFIGTSLKTDVRRNSRLQIIEAYSNTLRKSLDFYGYSHLAPSIDEVLKECKRLDLFYMMVLISILSVTSTDVENAFDVENLVGEAEESAHNPKLFENLKNEVDQELKQWAKDGLF